MLLACAPSTWEMGTEDLQEFTIILSYTWVSLVYVKSSLNKLREKEQGRHQGGGKVSINKLENSTLVFTDIFSTFL